MQGTLLNDAVMAYNGGLKMGTYRKEWNCCGSVTETEAWEPETCPFCTKDVESLLKDAERYRHCKAHGHPKQGVQCSAWTYDGKMVLGATLEEALDNAIESSKRDPILNMTEPRRAAARTCNECGAEHAPGMNTRCSV